MERIAFIHGSSAGQSAVIPTNALTPICKNIADFYFGGRNLRMKSSNAKCALFVELIRDTQGGSYCLYSFVNNECLGPQGREGQYFAISILCKNFYVADFDKVYRVFESLYKEIIGTDVIFDKRTVGNDKLVYKIAQFADELKRVEAYCTAAEKAFDKEFAAICKPLPPNAQPADYDGWTGAQISSEDCASPSTKDALFKNGRVYISSEYPSSSRQVDDLRRHIARLQAENANLREQLGASDLKHRNENSKALEDKEREIERLQGELSNKDKNIETLLADIEAKDGKVALAAKQLQTLAGKAWKDVADNTNKSGKEAFKRKDYVNIVLHILTLILLIIFFIVSNGLSNDDKPATYSPTEEVVETVTEEVTSTPELSLSLGEKMLHFEARGGQKPVSVATNGTVECTYSENWITAAEKAEASAEPKKTTQYKLTATDANGTTIKSGANVNKEQRITIRVNNHNKDKGYGWTMDGCRRVGEEGNTQTATFEVTEEKGVVTIGYGLLGADNSDKREKFILKVGAENSSAK